MMPKMEKPRDYRDFICWVILNSTDKWHRDFLSSEQQYTLDKVYQALIDGLPATKTQMKDLSMHPILIEMLKMSKESFRKSFSPIYNVPYLSNLLFKTRKNQHTKKAIYILQEVLGIILAQPTNAEKI